MAFEVYLFQFGTFVFPLKYIEWNTYDSAPGQRQSLDAYTDANGVTHDNALEHSKTEVKFSTLPMSGSAWEKIMGKMVENYINHNARDAEIIIFFNIVSKYNTKKPPDKRFYKLLIFCKFVTEKIYI